jgi:hypothetical protein
LYENRIKVVQYTIIIQFFDKKLFADVFTNQTQNIVGHGDMLLFEFGVNLIVDVFGHIEGNAVNIIVVGCRGSCGRRLGLDGTLIDDFIYRVYERFGGDFSLTHAVAVVEK